MSYEEPTTEEKVEGLAMLLLILTIAVGVTLATGNVGLGLVAFSAVTLFLMVR